jgi:hypothetical protein
MKTIISSVLLIITCVYSIIVTNNLKEDKRILLKTVISLNSVLDECDKSYNENVRLLDSIVESNSTIEKRMLIYLHNERRWQKENR